MAMGARKQEEKLGEIVLVVSEGKFRDGVGGRRAVSGQQTPLRDQDIQRLPAVTLESVTASLSVASSIKGMVQPQSSMILWAHVIL